MKTKFRFIKAFALTVSMMVCIAIINPLAAQTNRPAQIDKTSNVISLDESVPFGYIYYLDIQNMNFSSRVEAKKHFRQFNTAIVSFTVHFEEKTVNVQLDLRAKNEWTIKDWNTYLAEITATKKD